MGYNPNNRGFPGVAAQGWNIFIRIQDPWEEIGGTSASSPIFAGMISLMNDHQRKNGKKPLGFINPMLYAMANTTGIFQRVGDLNTNNKNGCRVGFVSAPQNDPWDPVTGLGTLRLDKALQWLDAHT